MKWWGWWRDDRPFEGDGSDDGNTVYGSGQHGLYDISVPDGGVHDGTASRGAIDTGGRNEVSADEVEALMAGSHDYTGSGAFDVGGDGDSDNDDTDSDGDGGDGVD